MINLSFLITITCQKRRSREKSSYLDQDQGKKHLIYREAKIKSVATAKSLQSCPTLCDPIDGRPPGSPVPGILQARTLEWVAISFSNAWKWKVKVKSLSHVWLLATHGLQPTRLLHPWDFPGKSTGEGCHRLLQKSVTSYVSSKTASKRVVQNV